MSPKEMVLFTSRQWFIGAWETADEIILAVSLLGFALLFVLLLAGNRIVPLKVIYITALAVTILTVAMLFGATDPVFGVDYIITPVLAIGRIMFFFIADLITEAI